MPHAPPHKLGYDDYARLPDDGKRYELLDGEVFVTPAPNTAHQRAARRIFRHLDAYFADRAEIFWAPTDVILGPHDVLQPDLVVVDDPTSVSERGIERAPLLVVEILSPSTQRRDRTLKLRRYAALGVGHVWLVDYEIPAIECVRPRGGDAERIVHLEGRDTVVEHPDFPGLSFRLGTIQEP
ncbi:MAG TPA: Uma2 family endonuclease [Candidatus Polarisedimenticolaceae bacterium]